MAGYIRQSTFVDGDTITAALFNNEYNQLVNAFSNTSGHKHDGTTAEGPVIGLIGDAGETSPNNKVLIDTTNNYIEFYVEVSSAPVQQLYIADGAIIPVTDSDIDLGTTSLRFKDTYTDTVTTTGNVSIGGDLTVTGSATISGNLTFGDADTDSINLAAEIDSDIIPNTDGTYDLGSATKEWQDLYIDGTANIDSLVADTADINGGTIDGATIATSDITVGAGKTLDVSAGTLTLADNQISGDKVEGGTIAATTITTLTSTTGNITNVNATTLDTTNIEVTNLKAKDGTSAGSIANTTGVVTLASSVLTTTDINGGTIDGVTIGGTSAGAVTFTDLSDGTITIAGFADEDNMVSDSATLLPTQQSVKAYVDSQVTAQDLDFQGDTGGALSIDLDSESLTIAGGTGLDTVGSGNTVTINIDSTVATLTGTQTLTNKTLTTPIISSISNTGTLTLPTSTDTLVGRATTDTLTNKTLTSPVINTSVSGTAFLDDDTFATASATTLASSESIKAYVDTTVAATNEVVEDSTPQLGGDLDTNGNDILFGDSDKAIFGAGSDLQIYHDGSNSYIQDNGTGALILEGTTSTQIKGSAFVILRSTAGENMAIGNANGSFDLYYDNSPKLSTTSTGIDVTGTVVSDGVEVDGLLHIDGSDNSNVASFALTRTDASWSIDNETNFRIYGNTGDTTNPATKRFEIGTGGDISFYEDTGTTQGLFWDASAESLGIGTTSIDYQATNRTVVHVEGSAGALLALEDTGAKSYFFQSGNDLLLENDTASGSMIFGTNNSTERMRIDSSGNVGIGTSSPSTHNAQLASFKDGGSFAYLGHSNTGGTFPKVSALSFGSNAVSFTHSTNGGTNALKGSAQIAAIQSASSNAVTTMAFYTTSGGVVAERMRINGSGNIGIGTTSVSASRMQIKGANNTTDAFGDGLKVTSNNENVEMQYSWAGMNASATMKFATAGSEAMRIDSSGNVGIGTDSPAAKLDLHNGSSDCSIRFGSDTGDWTFTNIRSSHALTLSDSDGTGEVLRVDTSGNLLVGTTEIIPSNSSTEEGISLAAGSYGGFLSVSRDGGTAAAFNRMSSDGQILDFRKDGSAVGSIGSTSGVVSYIVLDPRSSLKGAGIVGGSIDANTGIINPTDKNGTIVDGAINLGNTSSRFKDLYLSGGAYLGGTGSANKLDDYEEGTWTPVLTAVSGTKTWSYSAAAGYYTKVGNVVTVWFNIQLSSDGSGTDGNARITGLPFTHANATDLVAVYGHFWKQLLETSDVALQGRVPVNQSYIELQDGSANYPDISPINTSVFVNDRRVRGTIQYRF